MGLDTGAHGPNPPYVPPTHQPEVDHTARFQHLAPTAKPSNSVAHSSYGVLLRQPLATTDGH